MPDRQQAVNFPDDGLDGALALFIADVQELAGRFREMADAIARAEDQTRARWYALSVFSAEPLTVPQAARRLGTTRQAVQRSADDLVARGLAHPAPNPDHRTSPFIRLTPAGEALLQRISDRAAQERGRWLPDTAAADLQDGHQAVRRLLAVLRDA
ncbi:MarR family transcriptional regulator [Modestobacter sp. NPDC049651]|uniref:MarR family winged helix-turn-helix transcriptional regulator n=1 Tax=unclassified Modestobacter TaxID=2643866 RepID=UPI0033D797B3